MLARLIFSGPLGQGQSCFLSYAPVKIIPLVYF